jgi:hypothetical protein
VSKVKRTKPRATYVPLTEDHIECLRLDLSKVWEESQIDTLCDMATNSLLYAQEIQRLRDSPVSETVPMTAPFASAPPIEEALRTESEKQEPAVAWAGEELEGAPLTRACIENSKGRNVGGLIADLEKLCATLERKTVSATRPISEVSVPLATIISTPCPHCGKTPMEAVRG